eukprot:jgi/Galph1/1828/GphlegSOOS_G519.1
MEEHLKRVQKRNRIVVVSCVVFVSLVYAGTMIRMKQTAPGNLAEMEPLPPEEEEEGELQNENKGSSQGT